MKALKDHTILYDDECPLCDTYTNLFISNGLLDQRGRKPYSKSLESEYQDINWHRAKNEIAMINNVTGQVTYGVHSIVAILSNNYPWIGKLAGYPVIRFLLMRLYYFISYNRKVIAPGRAFEGVNCCTPDMNYTYRWVYIVLAWLLTSLVLTTYSSTLGSNLAPSDMFREFMICGGQIVFQSIVMQMVHRRRTIHYLGNMMTVSFMGALMLLPMLMFQRMVPSPGLSAGYFLLVVGFMFFEHLRRCRILELPMLVSISWVVYRLAILVIIL